MEWNKIKKYLPGFSLHYYEPYKDKIPLSLRIVKAMGHVAYFMISAGTIMWYGFGLCETGELNPIKQFDKLKQNRELYFKEEQEYKRLWGRLFGDEEVSMNGLADLNHDWAINFDEKIQAWRKMGFENIVFMEGEEFPKPTLNDLEKAVQSYETEQIGEK